MLLTHSPVANVGIATDLLPLDLHVLGLSLAFILSQDQTLHCIICFYCFPFSGSCGCRPLRDGYLSFCCLSVDRNFLKDLSSCSPALACPGLPGFYFPKAFAKIGRLSFPAKSFHDYFFWLFDHFFRNGYFLIIYEEKIISIFLEKGWG